jgi:hypothetical protein
VPRGFAARVARRAFAGDTGESDFEIVPAERPGALAHASRPRGASDENLLRFVLQATAAAALLVLGLSFALRSLTLPAGTSLRAADGRNEITVEKALERLDQLNRTERAKPAHEDPPASRTTRP